MSDQVGAYEVADFYLSAIQAALTAAGSDPITLAYVGVGVPVWDDCCGQLVVSIENAYEAGAFPRENGDERRCDPDMVALVVSAALVRCVPTLTSTGQAPKQADLTASHLALYRDAVTVWRAMAEPPPADYEWSTALLRQTPVTPTGGCVSIETRLTVGVPTSIYCNPPAE